MKPEHPLLVLGGILLFVVIHKVTVHDPLDEVPGPWLAKYTSLLLAYHARGGKRYLYVDSLHKVRFTFPISNTPSMTYVSN